MARHKDRKKSRAKRIQEAHNVLRLIGRARSESGLTAEKHLCDLLDELYQNAQIAEVIRVAQFSWADFVLHTDCIVRRLDGALVPIQVKSSFASAHRFVRQHLDSCIKKFKSLPVLVVAPSYGFCGKELHTAKQSILDNINTWKGRFQYEDWMSEYSPLFNFGCFRHLGRNALARIRIFQRQHPEHFANPSPTPS